MEKMPGCPEKRETSDGNFSRSSWYIWNTISDTRSFSIPYNLVPQNLRFVSSFTLLLIQHHQVCESLTLISRHQETVTTSRISFVLIVRWNSIRTVENWPDPRTKHQAPHLEANRVLGPKPLDLQTESAIIL